MKVYKDEGGYNVLVTHDEEHPLKRGQVELTGLLHYFVSTENAEAGSPEAGHEVEIFDGASEVFYALDNDWEGINWDALNLLLDEVEGITEDAVTPDAEYYGAVYGAL